jgi:glycosyltransferase involved in cell wall biosynthesis
VALYFINRYFYPDQSATSQLLTDLAVALADGGRAVTVITSRQNYAEPTVSYPPRGTLNGVKIVRIWTTRFGRGRLIGRAVDYATFYLSLAWTLMRIPQRGDVIVAKTDPPMLSVVAGPIARLRGAKLVNWLQDLFPEVAEVVGVGPRAISGPVYRIMKWMRDRSLQGAQCNVVLGDLMAERVEKLGVAREKIRIIPNWADGEGLRPVAEIDNPLREAWGLRGRFVVGYSGNLGRAHEYLTFLEAMTNLAGRAEGKDDAGSEPAQHGTALPELAWLFIGGGALYDEFRQDVSARALKGVHFKPYQPRESLAQSLSAADVHLVSLREDLEGLIVPSKFYAVAAVGRPVVFIGSPDGEIARLLKRYACGLTVPPGDGAALATALTWLAENPDERSKMGARARHAFETAFDKPLALQAWHKLLGEVGDRP